MILADPEGRQGPAAGKRLCAARPLLLEKMLEGLRLVDSMFDKEE